MTIMLNGIDLTVTPVVAVARHGEAAAQGDGTRPADLEPVVDLVTRSDLNPEDPGRLNPAVQAGEIPR